MSVLERSTTEEQHPVRATAGFFATCVMIGVVLGVPAGLVAGAGPDVLDTPPPVSTAGTLAPPTSGGTPASSPTGSPDQHRSPVIPRGILEDRARVTVAAQPTGTPSARRPLAAATTVASTTAVTVPATSSTTPPPIQPSTIPAPSSSTPPPIRP